PFKRGRLIRPRTPPAEANLDRYPSSNNLLSKKKRKMPPSTKHLLEKFLSLFSCSHLGDDEDDDNEANSRPLVIGGPVDFRHHETEGGGPLRAPISGAPEPFVR
ncbi:hypothetical protein D6C86_04523, partial [Aureobasidium pullulans]